MSKKTVVLIILDGWGIGRADASNPIHAANPKTVDYLESHYQSGALQASGIAVGLPWGEEGNSEVGHLTIGAGKVLYQHFPRITLAIQDGSFFKNKTLLSAAAHAIKNNSAVNIAGIISEGNVHASIQHLIALVKLMRSQSKTVKIKLHLFSDGKDSPPNSILVLLKKLDDFTGKDQNTKLASLSGRYFAMDRDRHWDRTFEAYQALIGEKEKISDIPAYVSQQYQRGLSDVYLPPVCIGPELNPIASNDALIFFNFREDNIRQLVTPFTLPGFGDFKIKPLKNLYLATLTQYSDQFKANIAFPPEKINNPLGKILADNGKFQLRVAETEKYAHVTYFFNGLTDKPLKNEFRILIPSRNIIRHDDHPEMMAEEIATRIIQVIEDRNTDFVLANFANPDMVAHTGNFAATVQAIKIIDDQLEKIVKALLATDAILVITADHGNAEKMVNPITGEIETKHDPSPVPFHLVGKGFESPKSAANIRQSRNSPIGALPDVAPTILALLGLPKPAEMTGQSLLGKLY